MNFNKVKLLIACATVVIAPLTTAVNAADIDVNEFKTECNKAWMEGADKSTDKVAFKNVGEKYCDCVAQYPLNDKDTIKKNAPACISQVLLHDTMDTIESDKGLASATAEGIESGCNDEWTIINSGLNGITTPTKSPYCTCSASKLMDLTNNRDDVTDKEWYEKINDIAKNCTTK